MSTTQSVVIIRFPQSSQAYQALGELRGLNESLASLEVRSAALAERTSDGTLRIPEQSDAVIGAGVTAGGLVGMLVGVLGGPLGVLFGFGTGALVGGVLDIDRATSVDGALALLSAQIPPGSTALIVDAVETTPEPLDRLAARFGATIQRQPADRVAAEVEAAAAAAEAAQKEANGWCASASAPRSARRSTRRSTRSRRLSVHLAARPLRGGDRDGQRR